MTSSHFFTRYDDLEEYDSFKHFKDGFKRDTGQQWDTNLSDYLLYYQAKCIEGQIAVMKQILYKLK
jgi:hypothetical protein